MELRPLEDVVSYLSLYGLRIQRPAGRMARPGSPACFSHVPAPTPCLPSEGTPGGSRGLYEDVKCNQKSVVKCRLLFDGYYLTNRTL